MTAYGHQIVIMAADDADWYNDQDICVPHSRDEISRIAAHFVS